MIAMAYRQHVTGLLCVMLMLYLLMHLRRHSACELPVHDSTCITRLQTNTCHQPSWDNGDLIYACFYSQVSFLLFPPLLLPLPPHLTFMELLTHTRAA